MPPAFVAAGPIRAASDRPGLTEEEVARVRGAAGDLGVPVDDTVLALLGSYHLSLLNWSRRLNLVSRVDLGRIVQAHLVDSMRLLPYLPDTAGLRLVDIGSGAGFPGVVLKIFRRDIRVTLMDASEKRRMFLAEVCRTLGLDGLEAVAARAEAASLDAAYAERFDVAAARAAGSLRDLLVWARPLLAPEGTVIAYKPSDPEAEIAAASPFLGALGFAPVTVLNEDRIPWRRGTLVATRRVA